MKKNILITGVLMISLSSFSQGKDVKKLSIADNLFEQRAYFKSSEIYEKVANDGYKSIELFQKLGDSYFFNAEYIKANLWYAKLFELSKDVDPIYYYRYSQTLKTVRDDNKSNSYLQEFATLNKTDSRSKYYLNKKDYLTEIKDYSKSYSINTAGINTQYSDFGATVFNNKIVFTSSRVLEEQKIKKDDWTSDYYYSLYVASVSKDNVLVDAKLFAKELQTKYHQSDPCFTKDGKTMYFTRSITDKKNKKSKRSVLLKICKATLINGRWDNIVELGFNSDSYNCAHAVLSSDDKTLYFVSDMPGGYGDTDIYKVPVSEETSMAKVVNLGANINTSGKETFPWISDSNELYFASDGHLGLGGLDIFLSKTGNSTSISEVQNLGEPFNSQFDDFGFIKVKDGKSGYFASNREDGIGKDDIYQFAEKLTSSKILGTLQDEDTKEVVSGAIISVYDTDHILISTIATDDTGKFSIDNDNNNVHFIKLIKPDYETREIVLHKEDSNKGIVINFVKSLKQVRVGEDLAKMLNVNIQFDLNKFNITPETEVELQKIVQVLKEFPKMKINIKSYTDSRQTDNYNIILSKKRAQHTKSYLISKGILANRIKASGYGESKLLNNCSNGVDCTEEEHAINRRSEFIIDNQDNI